MKIALRKDLHPDPFFYYHQQFKIYQEPYLIWDMETWEAVLHTCTVYRIEVNGDYAGDVIFEHRRRGTKYVLDFSILPEYQGKGVGKTVIEEVKKMGQRLIAVTRKETLGFFLNSGFVVEKVITDYYHPGVEGYSVIFTVGFSSLDR